MSFQGLHVQAKFDEIILNFLHSITFSSSSTSNYVLQNRPAQCPLEHLQNAKLHVYIKRYDIYEKIYGKKKKCAQNFWLCVPRDDSETITTEIFCVVDIATISPRVSIGQFYNKINA